MTSLFDSTPREAADELEAEWLAEARARAERLERGAVEARDGDTALDQLERRLRSPRSPRVL